MKVQKQAYVFLSATYEFSSLICKKNECYKLKSLFFKCMHMQYIYNKHNGPSSYSQTFF